MLHSIKKDGRLLEDLNKIKERSQRPFLQALLERRLHPTYFQWVGFQVVQNKAVIQKSNLAPNLAVVIVKSGRLG